MIESIDRVRGDVPRAVWLRRLVEQALDPAERIKGFAAPAGLENKVNYTVEKDDEL